MRRFVGQGVRQLWHSAWVVRWLIEAVLALAVLGGVLIGALAWRLTQGPLDLPWLVTRLESAANAEATDTRLSVGGAALVWEGFRDGVDRPVDLRLTDITIADTAGRRLAWVPAGEVSLSIYELAFGRLVPRAVELDGAGLRLLRRSDGTVALDSDGAASGSSDAMPSQPGADFADLLRVLALAPHTDQVSSRSRWGQIRRIRIRNASLSVDDRRLGLVWQAPSLAIDLHRGEGGGLDGTLALDLALADQRLHLTGTVTLPADGDALAIAVALPPIVPATLASAAPLLAPLAAFDAPVTLTVSGRLGGDLKPAALRAGAEIGAGSLHIGSGTVPLVGATLDAEGTPERFAVMLRRLAVAARPDAVPTLLTGRIDCTRADDGAITADATLTLDRVAFADLAALWPAGVGGADGTRLWLTENITDGIASDGHVALSLRLPADLSDADVTALSGSINGSGLVLHWLRPVPPLEQAAARLDFNSPDRFTVTVLGARQGTLAVRGGQVVLTGLATRHQFADIDADIAGPVTGLITVLRHPRINLLNRRPIALTDPAGQIDGHLTVSALPLEAADTMDDVHLRATGHIAGLHLTGAAAGRDVDRGDVEYTASNDGLTVHGTALLGGIPAQLQLAMDFRAGPPTQPIQQITVSGDADPAQLTAAGIDLAPLQITGSTAVRAQVTERRNGSGGVSLDADFAKAALAAEQLAWSKPAGRAATLHTDLTFDHDRLVGTVPLTFTGEGVDIRAQLALADGAPQSVRLQRLVLATANGTRATDVAGEIAWPGHPGAPWTATLNGASVDVSGELARKPTPPPPNAGEEPAGPPWRIDGRFARVVTGAKRALGDVVLHAESDGRITRAARVTGTAEGGKFELAITSGPKGRTLTGSADDAGGLLRALDVIDEMRGGKLTLSASYDDSRADHPLAGTAEIADFRMHNAPVLGKLLQSLTVYGIVEAVRGPDLGFSNLIAPFRKTGDVIELSDGRAYSASLGMTAKGRLDLGRRTLDLQGTVVPAYLLNSLLGRIPLVGALLSPERGGGLIAVDYSVHGSFDDPDVGVNPLSAVTPGFLRGIFGIFDRTPSSGQASPATARPAPPAVTPQAAGGGHN
jgi:hypothetical protein